MPPKKAPPPTAAKPKQAGKFRPKRKKKTDSPSPVNSPINVPEEDSTSPQRSSPANLASSTTTSSTSLPPPPTAKHPQPRRAKSTSPKKPQGKGMPRGKVVMGAMTPQEVKESEKKMGLSSSTKPPKAKDHDSDDEIIASITDKPNTTRIIDLQSSDSDSDSSDLDQPSTTPQKRIATKKTAKKKETAVYEFLPSDEEMEEEIVDGMEMAVEPRQLPLSGASRDFDTKSDVDLSASVFLPDSASTDLKNIESSGVYLFKLPTRLPSLKKIEVPQLGEAASDIALLSSGGAIPDANVESEVKEAKKDIPPPSPYNELHTMSGKIGRIDVYDDGTAELILTGENEEEIRMDVDDGIRCGFRQTAVWMDTGKKSYEEVGEVEKCVVVTPQL
ncbi:hypothetical protein TrLO_g7434 [Triparma laevis f. longispina]|uniref:Uncharacterized protein n=1 Tax=Triparma laevis f. longispina TaxID=1714387 RepID=A0A9W7DVA0_9STRA|nr:hypothetical protein TrLO_g7434 [Triparma laevis f. longispina]